MPSLAGRPPYATDQPDSSYDAPARRRQAPSHPTQARSQDSVYDVYDNYLDSGAQNTQNRVSGVGAAFMTSGNDSDSEDEHAVNNRRPMDPHHVPVSMPVPTTEKGKNSVLAAAVRPRQDYDSNPPPQYHPSPPAAAAIAAPRPGYAPQISALNRAADGGRQAPPGIQVPSQQQQQQLGNGSPSPSSPHPLQAPLTPIQPAFARPRPPKNADVTFKDGNIMRSDKEASELAKRGEKGDDFWRRFSMVVKDEGTKREKNSAWLRKTQSGITSLSRWVWIIGVILVIAAAGGIGLGWYMSHKAPDHYQPTAVGGSANESGVTSSVKPVGSNGATAKSSLHVTPTNTVARRAEAPAPTAVKIQAGFPDWMVEKRAPEAESVKIQADVPAWMQNSRKRHSNRRH